MWRTCEFLFDKRNISHAREPMSISYRPVVGLLAPSWHATILASHNHHTSCTRPPHVAHTFTQDIHSFTQVLIELSHVKLEIHNTSTGSMRSRPNSHTSIQVYTELSHVIHWFSVDIISIRKLVKPGALLYIPTRNLEHSCS